MVLLRAKAVLSCRDGHAFVHVLLVGSRLPAVWKAWCGITVRFCELLVQITDDSLTSENMHSWRRLKLDSHKHLIKEIYHEC